MENIQSTEHEVSASDGVDVLLLAIAGGDRHSFAALYLQLAPKIKTYLLRMGVSRGVAEELTQETMLTIWRRAAQFDPSRGSGAAWVYTIARNRWIDSTRRERHPEVVRSFAPAQDTTQASPEDLCLQGERQRRIEDAFETLSPVQKAIVNRALFGAGKTSKVAADLDIPLGTVKSHLRRAITRLTDALDDPLQ